MRERGIIPLTNAVEMRFIMPVEMNTTFNKQIKMPVTVNGCLTRWQHMSRPFGVVGMKT